MGGCHVDVISPHESLKLCADGGVLEHHILMVHHTSPRIGQLGSQPTSGNSWSSDWPDLYISRSSSQQVCQLDSWPVVEDSWSMDWTTKQLTTSWMHGRSIQASLSRWLANIDLMESTQTTNDYMWKKSSQFHGNWLDMEAINSRHHGSLSSSGSSDWRYHFCVQDVQYAFWCSGHSALFLSVVMVSLDTIFWSSKSDFIFNYLQYCLSILYQVTPNPQHQLY